MSRKIAGIRTRCARSRRLALAALLVAAPAVAPALPWAPLTASASAADPDSVALGEARRLADDKKFGEAARVLRNRLAQEPGDRDAHSLLARVLAWDRKYDDSIAEYRKLLAAHPDDAFDRAGYARVLAWSGRPGASLTEFRRAIRADSTDLEARVGYARAMSWAGDLAGASLEYRRILRANPAYGDAWLGYATTARWRGAPAASDRFLARAASGRADAEGIQEEREAVDDALALSTGAGLTTAHERQYVAAAPDFAIESTGPYAQARVTVARSASVTVRASRLSQFERRLGLPVGGTTLNYDLDMTVLRADAALTRSYPFLLAAGVEHRTLEAGSPNVVYPLRGDDRFFGWNASAWGFVGRFTPSASVHRGYVPLKSDLPAPEIRAGRQTTGVAGLAWQGNARLTLQTGLEHGSYSDDNQRRMAHGGASYRLRLARPGVVADYDFSYTDYEFASASYFTPLESARHAAGLSVSGWSEAASLDWGARYQFAAVSSANFENIYTSTWSGYLNLTAADSLPLGLEGSYSRDNNDYETWFVGVSGAVRW